MISVVYLVLFVGIASAQNPHVILIVADDLGYNDVPWHNKNVFAPNIQKLAEDGVILTNSYVQPLCSPSRSALMTGMYPFKLGRQEKVLWPLWPTGLTLDYMILPQHLKLLGYQTHAIGKWHLGFCEWKYTPTRRGFDTFRGFYTGSENYFTHMRHYQALTGYDYRNNEEAYYAAASTYSTYDFTSRFEELISQTNPSEPKFFYVAFQNVHSPLQVPDNYTKPYKHIKDHNRRLYLGMVTALDEAIGRIETALKTSGHYENSVIIFTTDNGGATITGGNNWPLRGNKSTLWEGGTKGAAFVNSPLLKNSGRTSSSLIHIVDWLPTILGMAGGEIPSHIDGVNQWDVLKGHAVEPRNEFVYNLIHDEKETIGAIRIDNYKLLVGNPGPGEWIPPPEDNLMQQATFVELPNFSDSKVKRSCENTIANERYPTSEDHIQLYDLKVDPEERYDLSKKYPEVAQHLLERLLDNLEFYVPSDLPNDNLAGDPKYFNNTWSPGWC